MAPSTSGDFESSYTERKSGFMKWISRLFKGGSNRRKGGRHPQPSPDENMDNHARAWKGKKGLDPATAPSSGEDLRRPNGHKRRTDREGDHTSAPQNSLYSSSHPPHASGVLYSKGNNKICEGCNQEILHNDFLGYMDIYFHRNCFRCHSCHYPITEREFSLSGRNPYHKSCFKALTHPKCEVCHQYIPINRAGLIEYRCHPFWSQKYCPSHEYDGTARCCSCERLESWNTRYYVLEDGRSLCLECMESAIVDTGDCQPLYHSIRDFYEGINMRIDQQIPMLLVEREALNEAIVEESNGLHRLPETRGLCLSEELTVPSVHRRSRTGGYRLIGMRTQPQKLTRKSEVTAILVLYGLPRLLTGAILAHELMHGWLRLKGFRNLNPGVEEGICQVLSHMWLESEVTIDYKNMPSASAATSSSFSSKKGAKSDVENKLGEFFMYQIVNDTSPAYGEGFREANHSVNKYGLRTTLEHIRLTGNFPL